MENRITLSVMATRMAESTGKSRKVCEDFLKEFFRLSGDILEKGENIRIKGFGNFKVSEVEARGSVNVSTGEPLEIEAHKKVVFTPSKELAAVINAPFEIFESVEIDEEEPKNEVMEAGSEEEEYDDEITYEAYETEEAEVNESPVLSSDEITNEEENIAGINELKENVINFDPEKDKLSMEPEIVYIENPKHFRRGFIMGVLSTLVVCLTVFMLGCFLEWWPVNFGKPNKVNIESIQENEEQTPDTMSITETADQEEATPDKEISIPSNPVYDIVTTTRYLTTIAREHYGNFNFWPYIYLENEKKLGHPDRITPGTRVIVPPLSKYGVDPKNKESEKAAKEKAQEIYSKFR